MRHQDTDRLLLRLPSWLGDAVMAEPAIDALSVALREGRLQRLALAGPERFFDLFAGRFEGVERVSPTQPWTDFDVALFLDGSMRSVMHAIRSRVPVRWGWTSGARGWLLTSGFRPALERGALPLGTSVRGRGMRRLPRPFGGVCNELVGAYGVAVPDRAPRLESSEPARAAVRERLSRLGLEKGEPYLVLDASSRPRSAKAAPAALWERVLRSPQVAQMPPVILLAAPGEDGLAQELARNLAGSRVYLYDAPPPTLAELLAVIEGAEIFLGTDSGPRHLATAARRPQVILCGPTDPRHTADHNRRTQVLRKEVDCGPCHQERCPLVGEQQGHCMSEISPQAIVAAMGQRA